MICIKRKILLPLNLIFAHKKILNFLSIESYEELHFFQIERAYFEKILLAEF